jgi:type I restriction enzyme S subunit
MPSSWRVQRFRRLFRESSEKIQDEIIGSMLSVSGYRGIEIKDYDDENRRRLDEELVGYRVVRVGQLVVNTMWLNYAGLGVSNFEGHVSPAYRSYWINDSLNPRYIHHLLRSAIYVQGYTRLLTGIRPNSLQMSREDLMDFPVLVPPHGDQVSIADFLDRETTKIDALIAEQERLINILHEKRFAAISNAVTRGLNPDAPMKPSGVEWLGNVPASWTVCSARRVIRRIEQGWSPDCFARPAEESEWGVVKSGCVNRGIFSQEENKALPPELSPVSDYEIRAGDILMSRAREALHRWS